MPFRRVGKGCVSATSIGYSVPDLRVAFNLSARRLAKVCQSLCVRMLVLRVENRGNDLEINWANRAIHRQDLSYGLSSPLRLRSFPPGFWFLSLEPRSSSSWITQTIAQCRASRTWAVSLRKYLDLPQQRAWKAMLRMIGAFPCRNR